MSRSLRDYITEAEAYVTRPAPGDEFDIEIAPGDIVSTYVLESTADSVTVYGDETMMALLETIRRYGAVGSNPAMGYSLEEASLSDLDVERQDYERMTPGEFQRAYGKTKPEWQAEYDQMFNRLQGQTRKAMQRTGRKDPDYCDACDRPNNRCVCEDVSEARHFRTAYGWAGSYNKKTGKQYKHPEQIKQDRESKKTEKDQEKKQGVAEGILGDREYNRVMPVVKRIAGKVSDYDRDEFGEELWSLLDQKYGSKFAQSVLQDSLDFYWDEYAELTGQQGVAEGSGPKEKQKTPYRDINSPEYRKAVDKQKQQMAKNAAAEPGKKLADKIAKKGVAEGDVNEISKKSLAGRIMRGYELQKKTAQTWRDTVGAEKRGDTKDRDRAFGKHVKYSNLASPGADKNAMIEAPEAPGPDVAEDQFFRRVLELAGCGRRVEEEANTTDPLAAKAAALAPVSAQSSDPEVNIDEGMMSEVDIELHDIARSEDEEELISALEGSRGKNVALVLDQMMANLADELSAQGNEEIADDNDRMIELLMDKLAAEYGDPDVDPEEPMAEAEYQGRKVELNKPTRGGSKKFYVYVKDPQSGNVRKISFGDPNMKIKKSNPERRKSFRARHRCASAKDKTSARYWSCKMW